MVEMFSNREAACLWAKEQAQKWNTCYTVEPGRDGSVWYAGVKTKGVSLESEWCWASKPRTEKAEWERAEDERKQAILDQMFEDGRSFSQSRAEDSYCSYGDRGFFTETSVYHDEDLE